MEASIVRLLKKHKRMMHATLVPLVLDLHDPETSASNISLRPTVALVKQTIESLLEKEYLARDGSSVYVYVA
jgi:hypothetical protein